MTLEQAIIDYFSKLTGTLVGILTEQKILSKDKAVELIGIIGSGIDEITNEFKLKKSTLDSESKI